MSAPTFAQLWALYGVSLGRAGESLASKLDELAKRPTADGCDQMIRELAEVTTAVRRLRAALRMEVAE